MKTVIFYASLIFVFFFWDLVLRILIVINYKLAGRLINKADSKIGRIMFSLARAYMGTRLVKEDIDEPKLPPHFLIISNHQSFLDIAIIYAAFPSINPRFVAKKSLGKWLPLVSPLLRFQRHALINRRKDFSKAMLELVKLAKRAKKGYCPVIFPEGTRSKTGKLGKFHSGAVRMVLSAAPMPVLSLVVDGGYKLSSVKKLLKYGIRYDIRIKQLKLYPTPKTKQDVRNLLEESEQEMKKQLRIWRKNDRKNEAKIEKNKV